LKKFLINLLKIAVSVGILTYLVVEAQRNDAFGNLVKQSKNWGLLAVALAACSSAVLLTLIRWYYLVRALGLPFTLKEAMRLGFLGYLFNLAPMGIVGGDLLKAVMLARQQKGHRAAAVATVAVDRVIGLYMLFVVAAVAILATGFWQVPNAWVQTACHTVLILTGIGTVGIVAMLLPGMTHEWLTRLLDKVPYAGPTLRRLTEAVWLYRRRLPVLGVSALMSIVVHSLFSVGIFMIARGLYGQVPSLGLHFVISPVSAATGVLPISIGPMELVLDRLYPYAPMPGDVRMFAGQGLVVALGYRIITVLIAAVGICYYLVSRREVAEVLHDVDQAPPENNELPTARASATETAA
jgi:hypothetical protein